MKKTTTSISIIFLSIFLLGFSNKTKAQLDTNDFVTTWKTDTTGNSNDSAIFLDIRVGYNYNYNIDWDNDGIDDTTGITTSFTIQYPSPGIYTIRISGDYPAIKFGLDAGSNHLKIVSIDQWGNSAWKNLSQAFAGCSNLRYNATDSPNFDSLSNIHGLTYMFTLCSNFNGNLSNWDVSNVTRMYGLFSGATSFNQPLNNWDVSNVTDMGGLFSGTNFNQPLNNWDVSNVTNMRGMFLASKFNQDISNWDVSSVWSMNGMFSETDSFNQTLNTWDVSGVFDMESMFSNAIKFNQPLDNWDVSNLINANYMFKNAKSFNQPLDKWDVSSVEQAWGMLENAISFNQNLGDWQFDSTIYFLNNMLDSTALSVTNYDSTLIGWQSKSNPSNLTLGAIGLKYCLGQAARDSLIADGWIFSGDTIDTACIVTTIKKSSEVTVNLFKLNPNPTQGMLFIEIDQTDQNTPLLIYNQVGQVVKKARLVNGRNQIDLVGQAKGVYFVRYGETSKKVILID